MAQKRKDKAKKRVVVVEAVGEAHIQATFNNIIISLTNTQGQVSLLGVCRENGFQRFKKEYAIRRPGGGSRLCSESS